jgi:hypothetical protein
MRCKYTFDVHGCIKPNQIKAFEINDFRFEFALEDDSIIKAIIVSFPVGINELPKLSPSKELNIKVQIEIIEPRFKKVKNILRNVENIWGLWGLQSIDLSKPTLEWIPENDDEKLKLTISKFDISSSDEHARNDSPPTSFDLLVRPFLLGFKKTNYSIPLAFIRKGTNDIRNGEYIEAFYDFYFTLESMFGNGKTKNYSIEKEMLSSLKLKKAISDILTDPLMFKRLPNDLIEQFNNEFCNILPETFVKKIVKLRGFLHHHNSKNSNIWNPVEQDRFKLVAFLMQDLCVTVGFSETKSMFDEDVVNQFKSIANNGRVDIKLSGSEQQ